MVLNGPSNNNDHLKFFFKQSLGEIITIAVNIEVDEEKNIFKRIFNDKLFQYISSGKTKLHRIFYFQKKT